MLIREAMTKNPVTVNPNASVYDAAKIMNKKRIGSVIVTDNGKSSGIMIERALIRKNN